MELSVGETSGDYIGCYLFGIEGDASTEPSYHSLATSIPALEKDCHAFFSQLRSMKQELVKTADFNGLHEEDLRIMDVFIDNLEEWIEMHLERGSVEPFFKISGMSIFLRTGVRERQKINGEYIE